MPKVQLNARLCGSGGCPELSKSEDGESVYIANNQEHDGKPAMYATYVVHMETWLQTNSIAEGVESSDTTERILLLRAALGTTAITPEDETLHDIALENVFPNQDIQALASALGSQTLVELPISPESIALDTSNFLAGSTSSL